MKVAFKKPKVWTEKSWLEYQLSLLLQRIEKLEEKVKKLEEKL